MTRCGITTIESLRKIIDLLPGDWHISTNQVGNLTIYKPTGSGRFERTGYIELLNVDFYDGEVDVSCEFTPVARKDE